MRRFSLAPLFLFFSLGSIHIGLAQDFRPSQNFDLNKDKRNSIRSPAPQDGALTQIEYERRRLEYLQQNAKEMGLDPRVLERQLKELDERSRLDQEVQQARANQQQWQAPKAAQAPQAVRVFDENDTYDDYDDEYDNEYDNEDPYLISDGQEAPTEQGADTKQQLKQLQELQEKMQKGDVSMSEIFDTLNSLSGAENMQVPQKYQGTMSEQLYKAMSSMRAMPAGQLEQQLKDQLSEHPLGGMLSKAESLIPDLVQVIQHPEALPDAALMIADRSKLIRYLVWNVAIFIINFFIRRKIRLSQLAMMPKFFVQTSRWVTVTGVRIGVFIAFFGENVKVLWQVLTT